MLSSEIKIRVRYGEVDRMGYLHHGNYPLYFEEGRTELIRSVGLTYREMEDRGILLPVREMNIRYFLPAKYDDLLTVRTALIKKPVVKLEFEYEVINESGGLLCKAHTTLAIVSAENRKPIRIPVFFDELIAPHFV
jgi:acyl-CoA thioester hydrolase